MSKQKEKVAKGPWKHSVNRPSIYYKVRIGKAWYFKCEVWGRIDGKFDWRVSGRQNFRDIANGSCDELLIAKSEAMTALEAEVEKILKRISKDAKIIS